MFTGMHKEISPIYYNVSEICNRSKLQRTEGHSGDGLFPMTNSSQDFCPSHTRTGLG